MSTFNLIAEVLVVEAKLNQTLSKVERRQNSRLGKLPIVRSRLHSRQIDLSADQRRLAGAKQYLINRNS